MTVETRPGRLTKVEQHRRERAVLQHVAAGHGWRDAAEAAGLTASATLSFLDRLGVGLPDHVQLGGGPFPW